MTLSELTDADGGKRAETVEPEPVEYHGITVEELSAKWKETVHELAKRDVSVTNQEHALEGALSIRYGDHTRSEAVGVLSDGDIQKCFRPSFSFAAPCWRIFLLKQVCALWLGYRGICFRGDPT